MGSWLHVVAAVIEDGRDNVLIALRPLRLHQGGRWEFPGGKVEPGETPRQALARELREELGISVEAAMPLIRIRHAYSDRRVFLDVWRVSRFTGIPHGREGQPIAWVARAQLPQYSYPEANLPIVTAARLPSLYLITPEPGPRPEWAAFLTRLAEVVTAGIRLVQFRAHALKPLEYAELAKQVIATCHAHGAQVLLNAPPELALELHADGVHLSGPRLRTCHERPVGTDLWVAASCHTADDLAFAAAIGVDFAVASPVKPTASHPESEPLGWPGFEALTETAKIPVFALGGVGPADRDFAWQAGGQGIAAIRGLWDAGVIIPED